MAGPISRYEIPFENPSPLSDAIVSFVSGGQKTACAGWVLQQNVGLSLPILTLEFTDALRALILLPVAVFFALFSALTASRRSPLERLS